MAMMDEDRDDDEGDDHYDDASTLRHKVELFFPEKFDLTPTFSVVGKEWKTYMCLRIKWRNILQGETRKRIEENMNVSRTGQAPPVHRVTRVAPHQGVDCGWRFLPAINLVKQEQLQPEVRDIIWALIKLLQQYDLHMFITI